MNPDHKTARHPASLNGWMQKAMDLEALSEIWAKEINRRAAVEQELWDIANGKRDLPTREECRQWAVKLGVNPELIKK